MGVCHGKTDVFYFLSPGNQCSTLVKNQPARRRGYFQMMSALPKNCPPALFLVKN